MEKGGVQGYSGQSRCDNEVGELARHRWAPNLSESSPST
jgi:hypothetical protein